MTYTDLGVEYAYISNGVTYKLNAGNTITTPVGGISVVLSYLGDQGFGLAPLHRITTRGPLQHGDSDIDYRLDPRIIQIPLVAKNASSDGPMATHYAIRNALLQIFNPLYTGVLRVRIGTIDASVATMQEYFINVRVLGGLTFDVDPVDYHVRTVVQLRADDPTWYEGSPLGGPLVLTYFDANIGASQVLTIGGNWPAFPIIRVNGPITNPSITNSTTGQVIAITATIGAGAYFDIDLSYGKKTVYDNLGVNRIATVSATSDLATWALNPGANTISVTGTGTTAASDLTFTFYNRYTGI